MGSNIRTYTDTNTGYSTNYTYYVAGYNDTGVGATVSIAHTTPPALPGAPGSFAATASTASKQHVTLTWTTSTGTVTGYKVYRGGTDDDDRLITLGSSARTYTDTSTSYSTTYTYYVRGYNTQGDGATASATYTVPISPPGSPGSLAAAVSTSDPPDVVLTWTAATGSVTGYYVYRNGTSLSNRIGTVANPGLTYTDTSTSFTTAYTYYVSAYNGTGESSTQSQSFTTPPEVPGAPGALTAANNARRPRAC